MKETIVLGLLQNVAILLAFTMLYESFWLKKERQTVFFKAMTGIVIGFIGIVVMLTPWVLEPGIIFDTRSVILSISGLFFGPIPTFIAMLIAAIFRFLSGGDGALMGIFVIFSSGTVGLLWRKFRPNWKKKNNYLELLVMGIIVHALMSACTMFLPSEIALKTLKLISLPLIIIYSPATMLLGILMIKQFNNQANIAANEALFESERRYNELMKSMNILSVILDKAGNITFINEYLLEITKYKEGELIGKNWFDIFIHSTDKNKIKEIFKTAITEGENNEQYENIILTKNGEQRFILWHNNLLKTTKGEIIGVASIGVDVTQRKKSELIIHEQNNEYASLNEEYKVQNEELQKSKEKAEESDRLKTEFINNMSHEIRTPMNGILGFSNFLNKPNLSDSKREQFVKIIQSSGNQLMRVIDDILEISKLGTKQVVIVEKEICLNNLLLEQFSIFEIKAKEQKTPLYLNKGLTDKQSLILTDETKLNKILSNLLENALKFTNVGFVEFGYTVSVKSQSKIEIEIYVKDTGIGIKAEKQKSIFERFSQEEKEITKKVGGLGLGLSIAKENVELLGGTVSLESEKGRGSTFFVTIPYKSAKPKFHVDDLGLTAHQKSKKDIILIVEDEEINHLYLESLLEDFNLNLKIVHAKNGKEAIEMCKENIEIKLVLMDLKMPIMNGFEATEQIRNIRPNLPIIAQTAYSRNEEKAQAFSKGCTEFITKPIDEENLKKIVAKYLK